jgi:hypothetical protein
MTAPRANGNSLRLERLDSTRLLRALAFSLVVHLLCWGGYELNQKYHLIEKLGLAQLIQKLTPAKLKQPAPETPPPPQEEAPLVFINVNPDTATPEAPKDAKYYSSLSSKAANPDPTEDTLQPKFAGEQTVVPETENIPRHNFDRLQPNRTAQQPQEEEKPQAKQPVGDLAMAKPELNPNVDPGAAKRERPRLLSQVQSTGKRPPNRMMKQDGGVRARLELSSVDAQATLTGNYDAVFIDAVRFRWYKLLEDREFTSQGHVRLSFRLDYEGKITQMKVLENTVSEIMSVLCQKAVSEPAPYEHWSTEMRRMIPKGYRDITFTFYYY